MGGTVGFTLRLPDGTEHRGTTYTNWTPFSVNNPSLFECDPEHLKGMVDLMQRYHDKFPHDRNPYLAPYGYGLIVVDCQKKCLYHRQGYTDYGAIRGFDLCDANPAKYEPGSSLGRLLGVVDRGWCFQIDKWYRPRSQGVTGWFKWRGPTVTDKQKAAITDLIKTRLAGKHSSCPSFKFYFSPPEWSIRRFADSAAGLREMRQAVKLLGFKYTPYESALWRKYIKRYGDE